MAARSLKIKTIARFGLALVVGYALSLPAVAADPSNMRNDEFAFHVDFPSGSKVCEALLQAHPHGFYAWYNGQPTGCGDAAPDPSTTSLRILAVYNTTYQTSPWEQLPKPCRDAKPSPLIGKDELGRLAFRRYKSVQCLTTEADGSIDIDVATQAGKWGDIAYDPDFQTPLMNYHATLHTFPDRMQKDLIMFRKFLDSVDILL